jgi:HK97 family phage major capsid protein
VPITTVEDIGNAITPEQWSAFILERLGHASVVLRSGARRIPTSASVLHVPRFTKDASAGWYQELEEISEGEPGGDDLEMVMRKCATLAKLSNEVVSDASRSSINAIGDELMKAVGLATDRAILVGAGPPRQPVGILGQIEQNVDGVVDSYDDVVAAVGQVTQHGGEPDSLYCSPADWTKLLLLKDEVGRPLIAPDVAERAQPRFASLNVYSTPALTAGTAIVGESGQIIVAIRRDPSVELSGEAAFTADGTLIRCVTRMDCGINDHRGLCTISTGAARAAAEDKPARKR